MFKANIHDMARIRIRRLCSVVLFITAKENICFFYGVSGCKTLKVQENYHFHRFYFSLIYVFESKICFRHVSAQCPKFLSENCPK